MGDVVRFKVKQKYKMAPAVTTEQIVFVDSAGRIHVVPVGTPLSVPKMGEIEIEKE
jgi:hypothetical protein